MLPFLPAGKIVIAWRFLTPKVGDIVVARYKRQEIIKRVAEFKHGLVYLLGDNPAYSTDSRHFGWLPASVIVGVVLVKGQA